MRHALAALVALATLSACSGGARLPAPPALPPPPVAARPLPAPLPPPPDPEPPPEPVVVAPVPPPQAPRGTVQTRTYYAEADVTEWVLTNGATVVFKPLPNGGNVDLLGVGDAPGCPVRVSAQRPAGDLGSLFRDGLGARAVYVAVGDARPGEVEQAAARLLTLAPQDAPCVDPAGLVGAVAIPAEPDADAALAVLVELLRAGGTDAFALTSGGRTVLVGVPDAAALADLRPSAAELAAARAAAARRPDTAAFWLNALADLYRAPGEFRPSRDPAFVARFASRVARVSARDVTALAARFAASPAN